MQENNGRCPACDRKKSMQTVSKFNGRDWNGSQCKRCGHFVPEVMTKRYELSCADCKKPIPGTKSLPYRHHEWEKPAVDEIKARLASAKEKLAALPGDDAVAKNLKAAIDQIEAVGIPKSWQERHEAELGTFYCVDCHTKRRSAGNEFEDDTHVRHIILCSVCGKTLNFLDIEEDKSKEEQDARIASNAGSHTGECSKRQEEIDKNKKALDVASKGIV